MRWSRRWCATPISRGQSKIAACDYRVPPVQPSTATAISCAAPVEVAVARSVSGIEILVRDRGPGVPDRDLERIFEPFYRVAESRDRDSGGEGIGLAITAQVMKAHGGSAKAANAEGGGLEVRLNLPLSALAV